MPADLVTGRLAFSCCSSSGGSGRCWGFHIGRHIANWAVLKLLTVKGIGSGEQRGARWVLERFARRLGTLGDTNLGFFRTLLAAFRKKYGNRGRCVSREGLRRARRYTVGKLTPADRPSVWVGGNVESRVEANKATSCRVTSLLEARVKRLLPRFDLPELTSLQALFSFDSTSELTLLHTIRVITRGPDRVENLCSGGGPCLYYLTL